MDFLEPTYKNMKQRTIEEFTHLYPVQKTLRFELKPVGQTKDWIEKNGLLEQDNHRAESYKVVKKVIDHYHKHFIDESLRALQGDPKEKFNKGLHSYVELKSKSDPTLKKKLEKEQESLRKTITGLFNTTRLFGKELIKEDLIIYLYECERNGEELPAGLSIDECKAIIKEFDEFTTYFTGFHENRKNMYSSDAKATAIAFRLIHENLPKFVANMEVWKKVNAVLKTQMTQLEKEMDFELGGRTLASFFEDITSYSDCLTQSNITCYNAIIGGRSEGDTKVQGINEYINLYNQTAAKKDRLPKMTELYKMILSDRESVSWLPDNFGDDTELLEKVNDAYLQIHEQVFEGDNEHLSLKDLISNLSDYNLGGIYIKNDTTLTSVVKQAYGDWAEMSKGLANAYNSANPQGKKSDEKYSEARKKWMDSFDSFSIDDICHYTGKDNVVSWYEGLWSQDEKTAFERAEEAYADTKDLLNTAYHGNLKSDSKSIEQLKVLLDALKDLQRLANTLKGNGDESGRDGAFYAEWDRLVEILNQVTPLYNMVRNYVTQKAYSEEKFKLNFGMGNLLNGWVDSKTENSDNGTQYGGYLFRKVNEIGEYDYYLGISTNTKLFRRNPDFVKNATCYERLDYYQLKGQTIFGSSYQGDYGADKHLFVSQINLALGSTFDDNATPVGVLKQIAMDSLAYERLMRNRKFVEVSNNLVNNILSTLAKLSRVPEAVELSKRTDIGVVELYGEIDKLTSKKVITYFPVSEEEISQAQESETKPLYLFKITNKDLSYAETFSKGLRKSRGTDNLHTMYFKMLMTEGQGVFDIGTGEVFYRNASLAKKSTHPANRPVSNKNPLNAKQTNTFKYDLCKDKRYSENKFQFHLSISCNYNAKGCAKINKKNSIDHMVREFSKVGGIKHIIGIDRGERHLLYLSMIDLEGNIVKQFSLNEIMNEYNGQTYKTNYHALLDQKESDRNKARKNWQTIEGIKDLKEGYLSQVVHIISQMMVEYQAILVLEDLNLGFMRGRQKVEKQVYQKFEKMLIDKLNYLVDKKKNSNEPGGLLNALQLTSEFDSFKTIHMRKQSGFLFYVPASLTSKIDPVTGFANYINTKYENREKTRELLGHFANIRYNAEKDYFEFVIDDYKKFNPKAVGRQQWTLCSFGERIKTFRNPQKNNEWDNVSVHPTEELKHLFESNSIEYSSNLLAQILLKDDAKFYEELLRLLGLILQMRNSITGTEIDYIISPVADGEGNFYCSNNGNEQLPKDADANGAYNIARKGLWAVMQMQQADDPAKVSLAMSNEEWMRFAQEKPYKK